MRGIRIRAGVHRAARLMKLHLHGLLKIGRGDVPAHNKSTPFSARDNAEDGLRSEAVWGYARAGASGVSIFCIIEGLCHNVYRCCIGGEG